MWFLSRGVPLPPGAWDRLYYFIVALPVHSIVLFNKVSSAQIMHTLGL